MTSKKNLSNQLDASAAIVVANPDDRVLVHLQQTNELANELLGDIGRFRSIDQSNGRNSESVSTLDLALGKYFDQSRNLRSTILTSPEVYTNVKNLYVSLQDTKIYFGQAFKKPSTSAKDSFVDPFKVISVSVQGQVHTLLESITAELDAMNNPNPQISVEVYQLGISHMYGLDGRPVNYTVAAQYFEHAASNGNTEAMTLLSKCYLNGHGVEQNESKGMEWLVQAANSKVCPHAKNELAMLIIANLREGYPSCVIDYCASLLEGETHTSRRRFENQVAMNSNGGVGRGAGQASTAPAAAGPEGQGHGKGDYYGVEEAIKLLLDAASDGCVDAKSNLGSLYEEAGDLEQAASW